MRTYFSQNEHVNTRCVLYTESFFIFSQIFGLKFGVRIIHGRALYTGKYGIFKLGIISQKCTLYKNDQKKCPHEDLDTN